MKAPKIEQKSSFIPYSLNSCIIICLLFLQLCVLSAIYNQMQHKILLLTVCMLGISTISILVTFTYITNQHQFALMVWLKLGFWIQQHEVLLCERHVVWESKEIFPTMCSKIFGIEWFWVWNVPIAGFSTVLFPLNVVNYRKQTRVPES